ncbi:hypothetical protein HOY80DRAFT_1038284 [Tuber brumale]|nr:hypothetical protein HOY80DRAFT_1038284 [Tuber brumale]
MSPAGLQTADMIYSMSDSGNIVNGYNTISISDDKRQVLEWISPSTSRGRHQAIFYMVREEDRVAKPVLLCYGNPDVGKTPLAIHTLSDGAVKNDPAVAYVYCEFSAQNF